MIQKWYRLYASSLLAGICISIGCIVNLKTGGVVGPIMFAFGLITVVHYKFKLFTGTAGFIHGKQEAYQLVHILIGNIIGCLIMARLTSMLSPDIIEKGQSLALARMSTSAFGQLIFAILCGFIMTTAVQFARQDKWLPLLFGVPVFILCGFYHCIADAFYICLQSPLLLLTPAYCMIVVGNFIGCNMTRWLLPDSLN